MEAASPANAASGVARSERFHRARARRDRWVRRLIGLGGLTVLVAIALIFFYLVHVAAPLFRPAQSEVSPIGVLAGAASRQPLLLAVEEQREVGLRVDDSGQAVFFRVRDGGVIDSLRVVPERAGALMLAAEAGERNGLVAVMASDGGVRLFRHEYETRFDGGVADRRIVPRLTFPYGEDAILRIDDSAVSALAVSENDRGLVLAVLHGPGKVTALAGERIEDPLTGAVSLDAATATAPTHGRAAHVTVSGDQDWLYLGQEDGLVRRLELPTLERAGEVRLGGAPVTAMAMLVGGTSVLVGGGDGRITQLFPVPDGSGDDMLRAIRWFSSGSAAVERIVTEHRRKGFAALDADDRLGLYHSTSGRELLERSLTGLSPRAIAMAPRADGLLVEGAGGALYDVVIDSPHPEVSLSSLWAEVWYENYDEPDRVWQSSAATRDYEPKFSLSPLLFGTVKAALYAMVFAIPLALMGAVYTACFMAPGLRRVIKPGIEIMAALPTVILGFLAGLWLAPFIERHLAGLFMLAIVVPPGLFLFAWLWFRHGGRIRRHVPEGFQPLLLVPVLAILTAFSLAIAEPVQDLLFGQGLQSWLSRSAGIDYDQRNALVVGVAMGFAVVPIIFSIAEDALSGVPRSLTNGSLALGATPWQTVLFVVLPTASPGIFSALMIGFGRAVGETMIVLMATGNTPIMEWNVFEGMRTLAANIAVELPESEVASTHYRILFLTALVLFVFTFAVNTVADVVRHRLRRRYGSL